MSSEETHSGTSITDLLAGLAQTNGHDGSDDNFTTLRSLAQWRENLPRPSREISTFELCSNCRNQDIEIGKRRPGKKPEAELWLEIETRCNLSCRFCYNFWRGEIQPEPTHQATNEFIRGLHRILGQVDCRLISIAGGEPLLRPDLIDILRAIQEYSIPTALATNGVLLTPNKISSLKAVGVGVFQIPLHSTSETIHDTLSAGRCWRKALDAIVWLRESASQVVPVFVATAMNIAHFPNVVNLCRYLGLNQIIFNRFVPTGQGAIFREEIGVPSYEQIVLALEQADSIASCAGITITLGVPVEIPPQLRAHFKSVDWTSCPVYVGQRRWTIGADLQIRRCNSFADGIGSVFDGGLERLLSELQDHREDNDMHDEFRPCHLLEAPPLVQITPWRRHGIDRRRLPPHVEMVLEHNSRGELPPALFTE